MAKSGSSIWTRVLMVIFVGFVFLMVRELVHVFRDAHLAAQKTRCYSTLKHVARAFNAYASDHDETYPAAAGGWMEPTLPYNLEYTDPRCPAVSPTDYGYAVNKNALGLKFSRLDKPDEFPLAFDSTLLGRNAVSGLETLPSPGRHYGQNIICFADGHVKGISDDIPPLNENPVFKPKGAAEP